MTHFSQILNVDSLESGSHAYHLSASKEEREVIAQRLDLKAIDELKADLTLVKERRLVVTGVVNAVVQQQCVRTLKVFSQKLHIDVEEVFLHRDRGTDEENMEALEGGMLDLGEIIIQILSLELDPYPVAPGSEPIEYHDKDGKPSPFDVLKKKH